MEEGIETRPFLKCLNLSTRDQCTLHDVQAHKNSPVHVFQFTSLSGKFEAIPVFSSRLKKGFQDPFPVLQSVLYNQQIQPTMFLISVENSELWLWQGWWPKSMDENNENTATGIYLIRKLKYSIGFK